HAAIQCSVLLPDLKVEDTRVSSSLSRNEIIDQVRRALKVMSSFSEQVVWARTLARSTKLSFEKEEKKKSSETGLSEKLFGEAEVNNAPEMDTTAVKGLREALL